jgi:hypothetical protein
MSAALAVSFRAFASLALQQFKGGHFCLLGTLYEVNRARMIDRRRRRQRKSIKSMASSEVMNSNHSLLHSYKGN